MASGDSRGIMLIFGSGFAALYSVFGAMYCHAYRLRETLRLNAFEIAYTLTSMVSQFLNVAVALLSILAALMLKPQHAGIAGYVYFLSPVVLNVQGRLWRRRKRTLEIELSPRPL